MNPESNHNEPKKRKLSATLTDDNGVKQSPWQYGPTQQQQQQQQNPSRGSNYMTNGGAGPCLECHCKCHDVKANLVAKMEGEDYLDFLPVGYRFVPTDEELVKHYLLKKIKNESIPKTKISEADIYGGHPKDLVEKYPQAIEDGWYFFTPRIKKYPNGDRPDRQAGSGYWKATGGDKVLKDENGTKIGGRKSLVYYEGHAPHWTKTKWMMHEYVIDGYAKNRLNPKDKKFNDYVLSKIYINGRRKEEAPNREAENGQVLVPGQPAHLLSNQDINNNVVVVQHDLDQNLNPATLHVDNNLPVSNSNQYLNATFPEVQKDVMVLDQNAYVVPNQDVTKRQQVMIQVNNNLLVQNYQNMGSFHNIMTPYSSFSRNIPPIDHNSSSTRFNQDYSLQDYSYFIPTPQQPPALPLPPCNEPSGSTSNPPPPPIQEGGNDVHVNQLTRNIEHMYSLDGFNEIIDDDFRLEFNQNGDIEIKEAYMWCNSSNDGNLQLK
ncbi:hypothetical protein SSX86_001057 [Deinandra increscens subsp. villosa]|uniref:NAC domain-containing protein n=1 Tax=Deinandra increscens subsp. villosa TaxID=3103831 RepID=A0AAP0DR02_9ASTR